MLNSTFDTLNEYTLTYFLIIQESLSLLLDQQIQYIKTVCTNELLQWKLENLFLAHVQIETWLFQQQFLLSISKY